MKEKLYSLLDGKSENHILPFFWQHGEDDATLLNELHKIHDSGIGAVCIESRTHEQFGGDEWYEDMTLLLSECQKLGMEFWLLDDKHFPTGTAVGKVKPEQMRYAVREHHTDVNGPSKEQAIYVDSVINGNPLLGVVAVELVPDVSDLLNDEFVKTGNYTYSDGDHAPQRLGKKVIDLTDKVENGYVFFDIPEGYWRVFIFYTHLSNREGWMDMLSDEGTQALIDAVYEPHYEKFSKYFGNVFQGYFSDEPFIMGSSPRNPHAMLNSETDYPWNKNVAREVSETFGENWLTKLPYLYMEGPDSEYVRVKFYDIITKLYEKHFSYRLGDWAREHGVAYIGHIVEDNGYHTSFTTGGHYFRSLDGQDMAGCDIVLNQIAPGMSNVSPRCACSYDAGDCDFFNFTLAKLASSHAHIQPLKKNRAMCEIFGAFGWGEGLNMMKWMTDFMLVRGINNFVPHAFTPRYPDYDCPPHFYGAGHNPEYREFRLLMEYMNRVSTVISDCRHISSAAVLYHAQAEWAGRKFMKCDIICKHLMQSQIDFDIIPEDYLAQAEVNDGKLVIGGNEYPVFIVPYTETIDDGIYSSIVRIADKGAHVIFIDRQPERTISGISLRPKENMKVVGLQELTAYISVLYPQDIVFEGTAAKDLRINHVVNDAGNAVLLTNEGIHESVTGKLTITGFDGGKYVVYDPMENKAVSYTSGKEISIDIKPYNSVIIFFGEDYDIAPAAVSASSAEAVSVDRWDISFAAAEDYDPIDGLNTNPFTDTAKNAELYNIIRKKPDFCGFVKYEAKVNLTAGIHKLSLGYVGEAAAVYVNGIKYGDRIIPPYDYEFEASEGENTITIITTSHKGYKEHDGFTSFMSLSPVGLLGPVEIK